MTDIPEEGYDLDNMDEEEMAYAILALGQAYNESIAIGGTLHNAMVMLAIALEEGDVLGKRGQTMRDVSARMRLIAKLVFPALVSNASLEQMQTDSAFEDIISTLDMDEE